MTLGMKWARQRVGVDTRKNAAGSGARGTGRGRRGCDEEMIQAALVLRLTVRAVPGLVFFAVPNGGGAAHTIAQIAAAG